MPLRETRYSHYFFLLENEGRKNLCTAAREFAKFDRIDREADAAVDLPVYFDPVTLSFLVICDTIPILHLKTLQDQIIVHAEKNIFVQTYTFVLNTLESNLRSCSDGKRLWGGGASKRSAGPGSCVKLIFAFLH